MTYSNPRIERLKQMLKLEEKRLGMQRELDSMQQELSNLRSRLFDGSPVVRAVIPKTVAAITTSRVKAGSGKRAKRGTLSAGIMEALAAAGHAGIRVKDIAATVGSTAANIQSWLRSTAKRHEGISKVSAGLYRLAGHSTPAKPAVTKRAARRPGKTKRGTGKRGALASKIVAALESAGTAGTSVKDIAALVGAKYRNISIWFATTGKKNARIRKLGPARYKLAA